MVVIGIMNGEGVETCWFWLRGLRSIAREWLAQRPIGI
jgi:hypothetical protein